MTDIVKELESITPKAKRKQIHQSMVEVTSKCGIQAYYRYVMNIRRRPKTFFMVGSAVDDATDIDLNKKKDTGELELEDVLLDKARDVVEHYPEKEDLIPEEDEKGKPIAEIIGDTKDKAVRLVKAHHGQIAPVIQPHLVHRRFAIDLDKWLRKRASEFHNQAEASDNKMLRRALDLQGRYLNVAAREGMDFVGEQDIVERLTYDDPVDAELFGPHLVIRDTKTAKKTPVDSIADDSHQLSAYSVASYVLDGKVPDAVKLDYVIDLKKETKSKTFTSHRDEQDVQRYLNRLVPVIASFQSGIFLPAPDVAWYCDPRYCAYYDICGYVKHPVTTIGNAKELIQIGGTDAKV